jgi:hypothetical protein
MRSFKLGSFIITVWWWTKDDKRQKKPTSGFGIIVERGGK